MKKNAMLKIAAILLVAVLLTTCAISSTFAKYVTEESTDASAKARVAAWGVTVDTEFTTDAAIFSDEYGTAPTGDATADTKHVAAAELVVAPGTENSIAITGIVSGTPEVSGVVKVTPVVILEGNWKAGSEEYFPVQFNGQEVNAIGETELTAMTAYFDAGTDLSGLTFANNFTWEWVTETDAKDTLLSENSASAKVSVRFDVTIEQLVDAGMPA